MSVKIKSTTTFFKTITTQSGKEIGVLWNGFFCRGEDGKLEKLDVQSAQVFFEIMGKYNPETESVKIDLPEEEIVRFTYYQIDDFVPVTVYGKKIPIVEFGS